MVIYSIHKSRQAKETVRKTNNKVETRAARRRYAIPGAASAWLLARVGGGTRTSPKRAIVHKSVAGIVERARDINILDFE